MAMDMHTHAHTYTQSSVYISLNNLHKHLCRYNYANRNLGSKSHFSLHTVQLEITSTAKGQTGTNGAFGKELAFPTCRILHANKVE